MNFKDDMTQKFDEAFKHSQFVDYAQIKTFIRRHLTALSVELVGKMEKEKAGTDKDNPYNQGIKECQGIIKEVLGE